MKEILDTIVQSCDDLGTLQQDGTVFLSTDEIEQCRELTRDKNIGGIEEEYRVKTFTTAREEYINGMIKKLKEYKTRVATLQDNFKKQIELYKNKELDGDRMTTERTKYLEEVERLTNDIENEMRLIRKGISEKYYDVEEIQYKDLVSLLSNLSQIDARDKQFKQNLDTTEEQLSILMEKRKRVNRMYKIILIIFAIVSILFVSFMIYYLFSSNTL